MRRPLGATVHADGWTEVRVWAPGARTVAVESARGVHELEAEGDGMWAARTPLRHGDDYLLRRDDEPPLPDPCSREQPEGVRGASRVVDPSAFAWTDSGWAGLDAGALVIYEMHVGAFTAPGTLDAAAERLGDLAALGITAVELMPVATFPGHHGWGYDGLYTWAVHPAYGGPAALARFVDAAHAAGLGVILDVVYNHLGPGEEALLAFGPYLSDGPPTPWGRRPDFRARGVREWAIQNAEMWVSDLHLDGLRVDAADTIADDGPRHVLSDLATRVRAAAHRPPVLVAESSAQGARAVASATEGGWGFDAHWGDRFHHELHVALTGERDGYYARAGAWDDLVDASAAQPGAGGVAPGAVVVYAHNHDQVGNRAHGDRLPARVRALALMWVLMSPAIPLLFMGDEDDAGTPFPFFCDHIDPLIADATRAGRRREFAAFCGFHGPLPDPQDAATFARACLSGTPADPARRDLVRALIALRRASPVAPGPVPVRHEDGLTERWIALTRGDREVCGNFGHRPVMIPGMECRLHLATHPDVRLDGDGLHLPPFAGAVVGP